MLKKRFFLSCFLLVISAIISMRFFDFSIGMFLIIYALMELITGYIKKRHGNLMRELRLDGVLLIISLIGFCLVLIGQMNIHRDIFIVLGAFLFAPCFSTLLIKDFVSYLNKHNKKYPQD